MGLVQQKGHPCCPGLLQIASKVNRDVPFHISAQLPPGLTFWVTS